MRDFEFIVVDDGSTDGTASMLAALAREDPRLRIITNDRNLGLAASLNRGIHVSHGDLIARMDADDISDRRRLEISARYLDRHPTVGVVGTGYEEFVGDPVNCRPGRTVHGGVRGGGPPFAHPTITVRREVFDRVGLYDPTFSVAEEHDLFVRMHAAGIRIHLIDRPLLKRRLHDANASIAHRRRQLAQNLRINARAVLRHGIGLTPSGWLHVATRAALLLYLSAGVNRILREDTLRRVVGRTPVERSLTG